MAKNVRDVIEAAWRRSSYNAGDQYLREYAEQANYSRLIYICQQAIKTFQIKESKVYRLRATKNGSAVAGLQGFKS